MSERKPDWALSAARELIKADADEMGAVGEDALAAALRKAKANGMRFLLTLPRDQLKQDLFALADKIERGEA